MLLSKMCKRIIIFNTRKKKKQKKNLENVRKLNGDTERKQETKMQIFSRLNHILIDK